MWLLLLILSLSFSLFFTLYSKHKTQHPPGPRGLPIIGNLHQFNTQSPHLYLHNLSKIYGPIFSLRLGSIPTIVISSPTLAKEVLKIQDQNFCNRPRLVGQQKLSYNGVDISFAPYSEQWREMKKVVVQLFGSKRVQSFASIREDEVARMVENIKELLSDSKLINLSEIMLSLSCSLICRIAFGKRYENEGSARSRFHELLNETQTMIGTFFFSDHFPCMAWLDWLTGKSARLHRVFWDLDAFYQEIIDDHLDPLRNSKSDGQEDIIDVLLQLKKQGDFPFDLTLDRMKALLMDIFIAGTDTSAATVVWAMTQLMKNPHTLKKLQHEIRTTVNHNTTPTRVISEQDLRKLPYLFAVVKETFRMHPAAPLLLPRSTIRTCTLQGYEIKPQTLVFINGWALGRQPEYWDRSEEFLPERFCSDDSGKKVDFKGQDFEFIPFGAGRRICPGMHLGVVSVELALANLVYWFDWELPHGMKSEDIDTDVIPGVTMHKKNALCLLAHNYSC